MNINERLRAILIELREIKDAEQAANDLEDMIIEISYAKCDLEDIIARLDLTM